MLTIAAKCKGSEGDYVPGCRLENDCVVWGLSLLFALRLVNLCGYRVKLSRRDGTGWLKELYQQQASLPQQINLAEIAEPGCLITVQRGKGSDGGVGDR